MKEDTGQILIVDKIVNNNIVIAKDFRGREVVAIGKGVGFRKRKNEAVHRSEIMKTKLTAVCLRCLRKYNLKLLKLRKKLLIMLRKS